MEKHLDLLLSQYGYIGIFLALALGVVGLPIPDELLLTFIGNKVAQGKLVLLFALGSAFLGGITGITLSYFIGQKLGLPLLIKYGRKIHITAERIEKTQHKMNKYGSMLLVFGYFVPGLRHIIAITAGTSNMNYRKFALFSYTGALLWCAFFIFIGRGFGEKWHIIRNYIFLYRVYLPPLIFISIVVILIYFVYFKKPKQ
ncbi:MULTISPECIES: DedA family protein [Paenibacillus]|uniref:DedA family protein n=1 Tax=Paenibacillus radicis (ex Xue et al. 2023) TaxID=2972489 RepID=A0ABT1YB33_9BACL|nr:DedA family protein [Paenibacillus radicis (ex Xue et al. 2023)]MCR8630393.1 DedA family protein [Paenibacillus radicis (ex Xue et al. 2023)]